MLNKKPLTFLTSAGVLTTATQPAPLGVGWGGGWGRASGQASGRSGGTGLLCSQDPTRPQSRAHNDKSEATSLPFSVASASQPAGYTMQEFALQYFRMPKTL